MSETVTSEWILTPSEFIATKKKVDQVNARSIKKGFTGRIEFTGERKEIKHTNDLGIEVTKVMYKCVLTGQPAHYDGWTFLAKAEWDENAGLIVRTAPGVESINREPLRENECDHCGIKRYRKATYIIRHVDTDRQMQIGSACLKDFLPTGISPVFLSEDEIGEDIERSFGGYHEPSYSVESVMEVAWAAIKHFGWVPSYSYDKIPTRQIVSDVFDPPRRDKHNEEYLDKLAGIREYANEMTGKGKATREFILSDDFSGDSEYVRNLKALMNAEYVSAKNLGFIVSAPQAWIKFQGKTLIEKTEKKESNWIGNVKDKVSVKVKLLTMPREVGYDYPSYLYRMMDSNGNIIVWFGSRLFDVDMDTEFTITGTIKKLDEFNGIKQTVLTRCRIA